MSHTLFILIIFLFVFVFANLYRSSSYQSVRKMMRDEKQTEVIKILALGDSYTVGQGVRQTESWPMQLAGQLRDKNLEIDSPLIIAGTSWTTTDLLRVIAGSNLEQTYDLVTLLIGVNDQFQGFSEYDYASGFERLLASAINFAGGRPGRVVVISIPDYSVTQFGKRYGPDNIKAEIDRFNEINKKIAGDKGVHYVDVTRISRKATQDSTLLAPDGLHPSAKMYAEWVELIAPVAANALSNYKD